MTKLKEVSEGKRNAILYAFIEDDNRWMEVARGYVKAMKLLRKAMNGQKPVRTMLEPLSDDVLTSYCFGGAKTEDDEREKEILGMKKHRRNY